MAGLPALLAVPDASTLFLTLAFGSGLASGTVLVSGTMITGSTFFSSDRINVDNDLRIGTNSYFHTSILPNRSARRWG